MKLLENRHLRKSALDLRESALKFLFKDFILRRFQQAF